MATSKSFNFITGDNLKQIVPNLSLSRCNELAILLNEICPKYTLNIPDRFHEFIAQVAHESGEFKYKSENLNYTEPRLLEVFSNRITPLQAKKLARNPQAIANHVYGKRLGNIELNDGWDFRGGGFIQLTGRDIYTRYAKYIKHSLLETANLVRTTDRYALDSACWVFAIEKQLLDEADKDLFITITKRINGGLNGLKDREYYYNRAKRIL